MKSTINSEDFLHNDWRSQFDQGFTSIIHELPADLVEYFKSKILEGTNLFESKSLVLELVVDTNVLFSEVRSLMINGSSFFMKISDNPFIRIFGPSQLRHELHEKIQQKFPLDKKTREFEIQDCLNAAEILLAKIDIRDDLSDDSLIKARRLLELRDAKDISFVALSFSLNTHGIMTNDKDIRDLKDVRTWRLRDAGEVITNIQKGAFSFIVLNASLDLIWKILLDIAGLVWNTFLLIIKGLVSFFKSIINGGVQLVKNIPKELAFILASITFLFLANDAGKKELKQFLTEVWDDLKKFISSVKEFFKAIWSVLVSVVKALQPYVGISLQLFEYFALQSKLAFRELEELEKSRPA